MAKDGLGQFRRKLVVTPRLPAEPYVKALKQLAKDRTEGGREDEWKEITEYLVPRKGMYFMTGDYDKPDQRRKRKKIIDSTPIEALRNAKSGLTSGMTPKAQPWLNLTLRDKDLITDDVREWLQKVTQLLLDALQLSNFYTAAPSWYGEILSFGTGAMMCLNDPDTLLRFYTFTAGEYYLALNDRGIIDTFYRRFPMTAGNIVDRFGEDNVSLKIKRDAEHSDRKYKYHTICHCIQPNTNRKYGMLDATNKSFESVYWEDQEISQKTNPAEILGKGGFEEFPVFAPRWDITTTQSIYGDGPGNDQIGNCMMLQALNEDDLKARHLETDPPMRIPPNYTDRLSLLPGAQNEDPTMTKGDRGQGISKLFDMRFDYNGVYQRIEDTRNQIKTGFFNDLFRMLIDRPGAQPPTAYEIAERKSEKIILLSPFQNRVHDEGLVPLVRRAFGITSRAGAIPRPPEHIQGAELKIEFISTLAQAQKLVGLQPIEMVLGFVGSNAQLWPSMVDKIDSDQVVEEYAEVAQAVEQIREVKAQQAEAQQVMDQMSQGAQIAKDVSGADLEALEGGLT